MGNQTILFLPTKLTIVLLYLFPTSSQYIFIMLYQDHVLMLHLISSDKGSMGLREQKGEDGLSGLPGPKGTMGMPGMKGELTGLVILSFVHSCYFSNNFKADYSDAKYNVFRYCKITHICNTRYILC